MKPANPDPLAQLTEIRAIMERSSRFLSLSGLSGVGAGVVALLGTAFSLRFLESAFQDSGVVGGYARLLHSSAEARQRELPGLLFLTGGMIALAVLVAFYFTRRRTHHGGQKLWSAPGRRLAVALAVPLVAGGLFCLRLYLGADVALVMPGLLLFYGLALLNASKYTLDEIRWLGVTQIGLGLVCLLLPEWGLLFFALGFGLGHIGYGLVMYNRYERPGAAAKPLVSS
ncbi:hypothetical protein Q5H92_11075 [Hymenobacter sp. M29]|uniref:Uncharacterized protein n=1 Tax=Hymenobacter mellowenesis TaxID=3063995 RepID=A0ABT9AAN7_9BACT|nr:hypothetical protein [Hymenobacter sp. M29]MDO7846901.1 hypothetical protein [Hymenobacter sp. M29]